MAITSATTPPPIPPASTALFVPLLPDIVGGGAADTVSVASSRQEVSVPFVMTNSGDAAPTPSPNATTMY